MPRYVVQRTFPDGLAIPATAEGAATCDLVGAGNLGHDVTWIHSYVSLDKTKTFCVYDAPSPAAIEAAAQTNGLPAESITEVRVLDPYFFH
ncbi:MAG: DUF4242 domain-containing protein [Nocardioides sp.]|uniref:DUF4242 domain-containing protein n=1 Tax=Nocardioides sp. TaxID=35761 RepID=UPI0039E72A7B